MRPLGDHKRRSRDHPAPFHVDGAAPAGSVASLVLGAVTSATCRVCGRRPHPPRARLTLAKLGAVLPFEFALHAYVMHHHFSYLSTLLALVLGTTILVIWVVEPSTMRLLATWLDAPHKKNERRIDASLALWRLRITVDDEPGSLERVTHALTRLGANILDLKVHPLEEETLNEIVVSSNLDLRPSMFAHRLEAAGGRAVEVEATSPLALVDVETRALDLAGRVVADPANLSQAVAVLLDAVLVTDRERIDSHASPAIGAELTTLRIPSPWTAPLLFDRPGRPFTPAESARAHRLAMIAEATFAAG